MSTPPDTRVTCLLCPPRVRRRQIIRGGSQGLATHIRFVHSLRDYYAYIDRWGQRATRRLGDPFSLLLFAADSGRVSQFVTLSEGSCHKW